LAAPGPGGNPDPEVAGGQGLAGFNQAGPRTKLESPPRQKGENKKGDGVKVTPGLFSASRVQEDLSSQYLEVTKAQNQKKIGGGGGPGEGALRVVGQFVAGEGRFC